MNDFFRKHPFLTACLPLAAAWILILLLPPIGLHNDDFQLWFIYCNGGTGAVPFSMYSGVLEGWLLMGLNALSDQVNWYLLLLLLTSSAACLGLNLHATSRWCADTDASRKFSCCRLITQQAILFFINYKSIHHAQYTYLAILCACVSAFLFYDWFKGIGSWKRLVASLALFCCAYELRDQSMASFGIMAAGILLAGFLSRRDTPSNRRALCALFYPLILLVLMATDHLTFRATPEWYEAKQFCLARNGIQDQRDNSGIDKSAELAKVGISAEDFNLFNSFTYVPGFAQESSEKLVQVRDIHQDKRRGLLNSELAARAGILSQEGYHFKGGDSLLRAIDPWVPLSISLVMLILGCNKRALQHALPMLATVLLYFGVLYLLQRPVDRVLHPVLFAGSIWILASPLRSNSFSRIWVINTGAVAAVLLATAFLLRHTRWYLKPAAPVWQYCAQHPQNLYLTTSMQHLNLFPMGWPGTSLHYLASTNIIPISDGWCFYTPAYKAALRTRGIINPYAEICKNSTFLITQNNTDEEGMLRTISAVHNRQIGFPLSFEKLETVGKFTIWKARPQP